MHKVTRGHAIYWYRIVQPPKYELDHITPLLGYRGNKNGNYTDKLVQETFPKLLKKVNKGAAKL